MHPSTILNQSIRAALTAISLLVALQLNAVQPETEGPDFATGIKIGEVTQTEAIIWVRLTNTPKRVSNEAPMPRVLYKNPETGEMLERKGRPDRVPTVTFPEGFDINTIQGATPGSTGKVRLKYRLTNDKEWTQVDWAEVDPNKAFTHQFELSNLVAGTAYELKIEARPLNGEPTTATIDGSFTTAPDAQVEKPVNFIVTTGTSYPHVDSETGYKLYPSSLKLDPDFFVHTGDIVYYDGLAKTADLARYHWDRMYSLPNHIEYHSQVPSYFIKDDHDTWMNDAYPGLNTQFMGDFTFQEGVQIFLDEVPMGDKTYRTIRWGKDLQIWLPEGRDYRSDNTAPDGPEKTIWGKEQMDWFKQTVIASDATFKVVISPTPIVGPDRGKKNDNHANIGFSYEGKKLRQFMGEQNMVSVCGDRHWQYVSKNDETGVMEISCGPGGNKHAGGWSNDKKLPEHIYLNVVGGFLEGSVEQLDGEPRLIFRHYDPDGLLLNEFMLGAE